MKINYKKAAKLITLLVSSILIATVSAQSYRFLYIKGSVSISQTGLKWVKGDEGGSYVTITISGSTVQPSISVSNGTTSVFNHTLYIQNLDASPHDIVINITTAANSTYYESNGFNLTIYNNSTGALIDSLNVLTTDSYSGTIGASAVWHVSFEIATKTDSTGGSDNFDVQFRYE